MSDNIKKNWAGGLSLMAKEPIVILPFFIIAFLEALALELIYFSPQKPLANIASPVIKKFFGAGFVHYPGNLIILPKLFYYAQVVIYIFIGVFLTAISVSIVRNVRMGLAVKTDTLIKNALKRYLSFFGFGVIVTALMFLLKKVNMLNFNLSPYISTLFLFLSNIILQTFLVLTIPILVIKKKSLLKALGGSIALGWRKFARIFMLIFLPHLLYLPLILLKTATPQLINRTFPEITLYIIAAGIILAAFVECFVIVCAAQFFLDIDKYTTTK